MFVSNLVLGFHGCDARIGERILSGEDMQPSRNVYDWLGAGVYFWENDPLRALEWARFMQANPTQFRSKVEKPFVIGAIIELGNCLDLADAESLLDLKAAYGDYARAMELSGAQLPINQPGFRGDDDLIKRHLDCAVINYLHQLRAANGMDPYTTVRGPFSEGGPLYPGAKIMEKTHVQVAVCDPDAIRGYFRVRSTSM